MKRTVSLTSCSSKEDIRELWVFGVLQESSSLEGQSLKGSWTSFTLKTKLGPNFFSNLIGSDDDHIYGRRNLSKSDLNLEGFRNPDYTCKSAWREKKVKRCIVEPRCKPAQQSRPAAHCGYSNSAHRKVSAICLHFRFDRGLLPYIFQGSMMKHERNIDSNRYE